MQDSVFWLSQVRRCCILRLRWTQISLSFLLCLAVPNWSVDARIVDRIVAYVNDDVITLHELEGRIEERALELQQVYRFTPEEATERAQQEQTKLLDQMLRERLLYQEAQRRQIEVTDSEVDQYIDNFKKNAGLESDEQLRTELKRRELSLEGFRAQARQNLVAQNLVWQEIVPKLNVTESDIDSFFEEHRSEFPSKLDDVSLKHIFVEFKPTAGDRLATEAEARRILALAQQPDADFPELVRAFSQNPQTREQGGRLDLSPEQLQSLPDEFQKAVNGLQPGEITGPVAAHDGFHIVRLEERTGKSIRIRHIFLSIVVGDTAKAAAQEKVARIKERLESGEDFASLAQEVSDDEETKASGGDLGTRNLNEFPGEIRRVLDSLNIGGYSTPVPTKFGIHIFKLGNRTPAKLTAEEREQVRTLLRQQKFEDMWQDYTDVLKEQSFVKTVL